MRLDRDEERILGIITGAYNKGVTARQIAWELDAPISYVSKTLQKMRKMGIVNCRHRSIWVRIRRD